MTIFSMTLGSLVPHSSILFLVSIQPAQFSSLAFALFPRFQKQYLNSLFCYLCEWKIYFVEFMTSNFH